MVVNASPMLRPKRARESSNVGASSTAAITLQRGMTCWEEVAELVGSKRKKRNKGRGWEGQGAARSISSSNTSSVSITVTHKHHTITTNDQHHCHTHTAYRDYQRIVQQPPNDVKACVVQPKQSQVVPTQPLGLGC